jgi:phosphatidylethanolamine/phosphatidyl-N-methylethanolamine N-methyltransferase
VAGQAQIKPLADDLDDRTVLRAYRRWAPVYDVVFGEVFAAGRRAALAAVNRRGGSVLEVGVGTGLALPSYRSGTRVFGIDLSHDMLVQARRKVARQHLDRVDGLAVMDAAHTGFRDGAFDIAVAMFLITVVPDPEGVMAEMARVVKPGGEVILVNHFAHDSGVRAAIEQFAAKRSRSLGWRPDFPISRVMQRPELELVERGTMGLFDNFTLLRFHRRDMAATDAAPPMVGEDDSAGPGAAAAPRSIAADEGLQSSG